MRNRWMHGVAMVLLTVLPMPLVAQSAPDAPEPRRIDLRVRPAIEPTPALKYTLVPENIELKRGNAAVAYMKVAMRISQDKALRDLMAELHTSSNPVGELPIDRMRQLLVTDWMDELEDATRYRECDWQDEVAERGMNALLPHLTSMRHLARCVSSRIRLHVASGEMEEAVRWLRVGFTLAQHAARGELLICELVGLSITSLMMENLEELLQHPDSPSMYWALTTLPQPLFSAARGMRWERHMLYTTFPQLQHVRERGMTGDEWHEMMRRLQGIGYLPGDAPPYNTLGVTLQAAMIYPESKDALVAAGLDPAEVETMSVATVISLHMVESYERHRDEVTKLLSLPYWEAAPRMEALETRLTDLGETTMVDNLTRAISPVLSPAMDSFVLVDRRVAAQRIVEALRLHAGANDGALAGSLDAITIVPIPLDPATGKPFIYRIENGKAVLELVGPPWLPRHRQIIYTIEIIK